VPSYAVHQFDAADVVVGGFVVTFVVVAVVVVAFVVVGAFVEAAVVDGVVALLLLLPHVKAAADQVPPCMQPMDEGPEVLA